MSIISNTTVLSNFASIDQLDLLRQLFGKLHIPIEVYAEIQDGLAEGYHSPITDLVPLIKLDATGNDDTGKQ